ncbi:hypothetical protein vBAmePPT11V19_00067 [Alteromonas phage vB_AmeP_PT11-V19]|nr:hypothetical protein vBAmePPT11V19_00067 [Alteromonas phage vB_AmeP_PT11-V19]
MNEIEKLFEHAPEGTTEIVQYERTKALRWANKECVWCYVEKIWESRANLWQTIATRPQPECKTVEDAVEWNKSEGFGDKWEYEDCDVIVIYGGSFAYSNSKATTKPIVCTREEFEACVAAKANSEPEFKATRENLEKIAKDAEGDFVEVDEPEWTHLTPIGDPCFIKLNEPDCEGLILIEIRNDGYELIKPKQLKLIKPIITEKERETVAKFVARIFKKKDCDLRKEFDDFINEHELTE